MGLSQANSTLVTPQPTGALDPATGKPIGADDPFFTGVNNELADKGFLTTTVAQLITWARTGSLMWMQRSEEHTSELQSRENLVCRLLLEKKNKTHTLLPSLYI